MASNISAFETRAAAGIYSEAATRGLYESEKVAFEFLDELSRGAVLDIGIGAGRTIPFLSSRFEKYIGIDYSAPLVATARERFPDREILLMDAREINFAQPFDAIVFSYNGIDCVDENDRQTMLEKIASHLRDGGLFIYSTHNLRYSRVPVWLRSFWVKELGGGRFFARRLWERFRHFWRQQACDGFAYVNDPGLGFSLILRYGDIPREKQILQRLGLETLAVIGATKVGFGFDDGDGWVYIVARKF